jgi:hypothetical protein
MTLYKVYLERIHVVVVDILRCVDLPKPEETNFYKLESRDSEAGVPPGIRHSEH